MSDTVSSGTTPPGFPADDNLAQQAVDLAQKWVHSSADFPADAAAQRLAGVLRDPNGLPFTIGFVDGVMRPESVTAAATRLHHVAPLVPEFLPWYLRGAVRVGGAVAPMLPTPVVPIARTALREMVGHLVVDARPHKLGPAIARIRESGARLNLNLLGEAVLGEDEARRRLAGIHELIRRDDVDYVSVKVSAIVSRISMWAFDEVVADVVERLLPLYLSAAEDGTFINLDMEEYRDLDLTIAVFTRLLEDERLRGLEAGIVLQAYLPDAADALDELTAWAQARVAAGGSRIKVRLVKGANLAMERVDATIHGWPLATHASKLDADAMYLRCLDRALRPERSAAVRLGVAGHNLFDIAYAWLLAGERGVSDDIEIEMLLGMAQGQVAAVTADVGHVLLYVPVVRPDEFDVAISYLVRRLEENASSENFLSAAFDLATDASLFERERDRFLASLERAADPALPSSPNRTQDRTLSLRPIAPQRITRDPAGGDDGLTQAVLGIADAAGRSDDTTALGQHDDILFGGERFVETAVYAPRETRRAPALGAPGFANTPDSDPALAVNREWARGILSRIAGSTAGDETIAAARVDDAGTLDEIVARVGSAASAWGAMAAADRSAVLLAASRALESRRAELIEVAASETGKVLAEADVEVSEAVDFAAYYAATARELDRVSGAVFQPASVTVVTPPWNFPLAIPAGGVLAALAAGSGVVFKPAPQARRCAAVVAEALWDAGVPRDLLALVDIDEGDLGRRLITHPSVDRVILTGSWETAALFRSWRPELPLLAETSGKNAIIVMPSADLDLAASDLIKSAFGHAGQKCSAASLAILVGPVGRSKRFARQLVDATRSLRVGPPTDPRSEVGPVIEPPQGKLEWALTSLEDGERWLVEPRRLDLGDDTAGRFWSPGVKVGVSPGSRTHLEEFFGPVLGIMHARTLEEAIELQNAVAYGLTAGLHTQDAADLATWLDRVEAGNLYVNRGITGAIVQRQPFGGWKRSSVGAGTKAGGPNYLVGLGSWRASSGSASSTLHLRGLDSRITTIIESAQPTLDYESFEWLRRGALSDAVAWDREFGQVRDVSGLGVERNLFRYRPVDVAVRASSDATWQAVLRVIVAGVRAGSGVTLSSPVGLPAEVRRALGEVDISVSVETDGEWLQRIAAADRRPGRIRLVGSRDAVAELRTAIAGATGGDPDVAVYADEVTTAGRIEVLPFVHEQSITITAHRFGNPDDWSEAVI
ncbi:bifunctional dehydrogenase [Microbacterium sp. TS-1]|uniref:L-glutamate gamma-semialdehyde dehydrogenase n=2 Tax=Microbacterium TaxID=33882 RepID=A0ABU1I3J8_9MICO|nr:MULTISPECIES: bifunctional proline dehydrogenase/L-glutamate gamma-semialdehyde dehydrogenase [Microbacterium]APF34221.1 1-pyrroline-5-carboxylate dehydrogenase [Microbacterium paludicola]MDR6168455.1 RHH-type proline utilization regulon transcriptional repressor/proline dehydrogenase/delta 1-pyrroline-5-carboxylate dehydrogenase [Microbacterium paludicola]OAZ40016.1 1-pyrroline-5-carboxylate dehydrogenase [Microbacterium arborescens]POX67948.1 1-pyrroline-5-carboxylate dehydrogenase [Microb